MSSARMTVGSRVISSMAFLLLHPHPELSGAAALTNERGTDQRMTLQVS
jgi:hypothetical protein